MHGARSSAAPSADLGVEPERAGCKAIFDQMTALPKVIIAAMNGDAFHRSIA